MNNKSRKFISIALTIFVVCSLFGFSVPLFASPVNGTRVANQIGVGDSTATYALADSDYLEGGHMQVPSRAGLFGYAVSDGATANGITITSQRRRVGMTVVVLVDSSTPSAGYSTDPGASVSGNNVTYQLISNPTYTSTCATVAPTAVSNNSLDGVSAGSGASPDTTHPCATTTVANWRVVVPDVSTLTAGQVLQTDGNGNVILGPSSSLTVGTLNGATGGTTKSGSGVTIQSGILYEQTADATYPGLVSTLQQTFTGSKTFSNPNVSSATGSFSPLIVNTTYNEPFSNASNTDLYINRNETFIGSGTQRLLDLSVGLFSAFNIDNKGAISDLYTTSHGTMFKIDPVNNFYGMGDLNNSTGVNGSSFSIDDSLGLTKISQKNLFGPTKPGNVFVLNGNSNNLKYSMGLASGYYSIASGSNVTFTSSSSTINKVSGTSFITSGFQVGMNLVVTGTSSNNNTFVITAVSDNSMTVTGASVVDETPPSFFVLYAQGKANTEVNDSLNRIGLFGVPTPSNNYGLVSVGNDFSAFNGVSTGHFSGNPLGTEFAINTSSGFVGNLADFQIGGTQKFSIDSAGNIKNSGGIFDSFLGTLGTSGQVLASTGTGTRWTTGITGSGSSSQVTYWSTPTNITGSNDFIYDTVANNFSVGFVGSKKLSIDVANNLYQLGAQINSRSAPMSSISHLYPDITFVAPNIINNSVTDFSGLIFPGDRIQITGSSGNDGTYYVVSIAAHQIIVRELTINNSSMETVTIYPDHTYTHTTNSNLTLDDNAGSFSITNSYGIPLSVSSAMGSYKMGDITGNYNGTLLAIDDLNQSTGINTTDIDTAFTVKQNKTQPTPVVIQTIGSSDTLTTVSYTPLVSDTITITIDSIGGPSDTYTWTDTLGGSSISPIAITPSSQTVGSWGNYVFTFGYPVGHSVGDTWQIVLTNNYIYKGVNEVGHNIFTIASDGTTSINNDGPLGSMPVLSLDIANSRYGIGDVGTDPYTFSNFGTSIQIDDSSAKTIINYAKIFDVKDRNDLKSYLNINSTNTGLENGHYAFGDLNETTPYAGGNFAISDGNTTNWSASVGDVTSSYLYMHPYDIVAGGSYYLGDWGNSHNGNVIHIDDGAPLGGAGKILNRINGTYQVADMSSNVYLQTDIKNNIYSIGDINGVLGKPIGLYMNGPSQLTGLNTILPHATFDIHNNVSAPGGILVPAVSCTTGTCAPYDGTTVSVDSSAYGGLFTDSTTITVVAWKFVTTGTVDTISIGDTVQSNTGYKGTVVDITPPSGGVAGDAGTIYTVTYMASGSDFSGATYFSDLSTGVGTIPVDVGNLENRDLYSWSDAGGVSPALVDLSSPTVIGSTGHSLTVFFHYLTGHISGDVYTISFTVSGPRIVNVQNSSNQNIFNIDDNGGTYVTDSKGTILNAPLLRIDPTNSFYGIGDMNGSYHGNSITINDSTKTITNTIASKGIFNVQEYLTGNKFINIETNPLGATSSFKFGDISGLSGVTTDIEISATGIPHTSLILLKGNTQVSGDFTVSDGGAGTCSISGSGSTALVCSSDERLKKNINNLESSLDKINQLRPVTYNWIDPLSNQTTNIGFIAQEVQKIYPEFVGTLGNGYLGVSYSGFIVPAIKAIQELDVKIEPLTSLDITKENTLGSLIKKYLENALNGLAVVFTDKLQTNQLCLQDVCVTKVELTKILNQANVSGTVSTPTPTPTTTDTTTTTNTDTTTVTPPVTPTTPTTTDTTTTTPVTTTTNTDTTTVTPPVTTPTTTTDTTTPPTTTDTTSTTTNTTSTTTPTPVTPPTTTDTTTTPPSTPPATTPTQ